MLCTKQIIVKGKVQGVFFRKYTYGAAITIGLTGFVKNLPDQSVCVIATGTMEQLEELINWCRRGSPGSKVETVELNDLPLQQFNSFLIER